MRRATTPNVELHIDECLTGCWFRVTFAQKNGSKLVKDQDECELSDDGKTIYVHLDQRETLGFSTNYDLRVQVKFGMDGEVCATNIVNVAVAEILDEEVI